MAKQNVPAPSGRVQRPDEPCKDCLLGRVPTEVLLETAVEAGRGHWLYDAARAELRRRGGRRGPEEGEPC